MTEGIEEIRERCEHFRYPWYASKDGCSVWESLSGVDQLICRGDDSDYVEFIAHGPENMRFLLAEVDRLTAENARLRAERNAAITDIQVPDICEICRHHGENCAQQRHFAKAVSQGDCFQWRGVQPEGVEE